jgi:hypothetical protein
MLNSNFILYSTGAGLNIDISKLKRRYLKMRSRQQFLPLTAAQSGDSIIGLGFLSGSIDRQSGCLQFGSRRVTVSQYDQPGGNCQHIFNNLCTKNTTHLGQKFGRFQRLDGKTSEMSFLTYFEILNKILKTECRDFWRLPRYQTC